MFPVTLCVEVIIRVFFIPLRLSEQPSTTALFLLDLPARSHSMYFLQDFQVKQDKFKSNTIANSSIQIFHILFQQKNYQILKAINNKQLDFSSIRRLILLMYYDQVFLLSNYSIIRFLIYYAITFFFYMLRILYLPWVGTTWVQVSRSCLPFWAFF